MIVIYTRAYNAETTLPRTVESILNQTYTDFRYILFNNGSNDSTLKIMREYAKRDKRVIVLSRGNNIKGFVSCMGVLAFIANNFSDEDYFCNIDADDVYQLDFFEKMLHFAQTNQVDTVCCGYNSLERNTGKVLNCKKMDHDLIIENEDLPNYFISFRRYTTDMWAKLFKVSLLRYYLAPDRFEFLKNLNFTQQNFIFDVFRNSVKVGFLSEPLLDYYVSNTSQRNARMKGEVSLAQARGIFQVLQNFLAHYKTSEELRLRNSCYLYAIYCGYIKDVIAMIKFTNSISIINKINYFFDIFSHCITKDMLLLEADDEFYSLRKEAKEELCQSVISFILALENWEQYRLKVEKIVLAMQESGISISLPEPVGLN